MIAQKKFLSSDERQRSQHYAFDSNPTLVSGVAQPYVVVANTDDNHSSEDGIVPEASPVTAKPDDDTALPVATLVNDNSTTTTSASSTAAATSPQGNVAAIVWLNAGSSIAVATDEEAKCDFAVGHLDNNKYVF